MIIEADTPVGRLEYDHESGKARLSVERKDGFWKFPLLVMLQITNKCNLSCPYCYADSQPISNDYWTAERVEKLAENLRRLGTAVLAVGGGEPFTVPWLMEALRKISKVIPVSVTTNGTLLDEKIVKELKKYGVFVRVSIHNEDAFKGVELLKKNRNRFGVNILLAKGWGKRQRKLVSRLLEMGVDNFLILAMSEHGRAVGKYASPEIDDYLEVLGELVKHRVTVHVDAWYSAKILRKHGFLIASPWASEGRGGRYVYIDYEGYMRPASHGEKSDIRVKLKDLSTESLEEAFNLLPKELKREELYVDGRFEWRQDFSAHSTYSYVFLSGMEDEPLDEVNRKIMKAITAKNINAAIKKVRKDLGVEPPLITDKAGLFEVKLVDIAASVDTNLHNSFIYGCLEAYFEPPFELHSFYKNLNGDPRHYLRPYLILPDACGEFMNQLLDILLDALNELGLDLTYADIKKVLNKMKAQKREILIKRPLDYLLYSHGRVHSTMLASKICQEKILKVSEFKTISPENPSEIELAVGTLRELTKSGEKVFLEDGTRIKILRVLNPDYSVPYKLYIEAIAGPRRRYRIALSNPTITYLIYQFRKLPEKIPPEKYLERVFEEVSGKTPEIEEEENYVTLRIGDYEISWACIERFPTWFFKWRIWMKHEYEVGMRSPIYGVGRFGKIDGRKFSFYGVPTILADLLRKKHPERILDKVYDLYRGAKNVRAIPFLETVAATLSRNRDFMKMLNRNVDLSTPLGLAPLVLGKVRKKYIIMKPYDGKITVLHPHGPQMTLQDINLDYYKDLLTSALKQTNLEVGRVNKSKICSIILKTIDSMKSADRMSKVFLGRILPRHPLVSDRHRRNILLEIPIERLSEFLRDEIYGGDVDLMKTHLLMRELSKGKRQRVEIS